MKISDDARYAMGALTAGVQDAMEDLPSLDGWTFLLVFIPPEGSEAMLMSDTPPEVAIAAMEKLAVALRRRVGEINAGRHGKMN